MLATGRTMWPKIETTADDDLHKKYAGTDFVARCRVGSGFGSGNVSEGWSSSQFAAEAIVLLRRLFLFDAARRR